MFSATVCVISNNSVDFKNNMVEYKFLKNERDKEVVLFKHDDHLFLLDNGRVFDDIVDIENITNSFDIETIGGLNDLISDESFINITPPTFIERILKYIDGLYVGNALSMIFEKTQTDELCLSCVSINGLALSSVKNQTEEICLAAIKENPLALQFVKNQTKEICLAAVKQKGTALQFVKNQTHEICLTAARQNGHALEYVNTQTDELRLAAVKENGYLLHSVIIQTYDLCKLAIDYEFNIIDYVREYHFSLYVEAFSGHDNDVDTIKGLVPYSGKKINTKRLQIILGVTG